MRVIEYVTEEVRRQGHDVTTLDGIERVGWMLNAWAYALAQSASRQPPTMAVALELGMKVEPVKNAFGLRNIGVRVGPRICPAPAEVPKLLSELFQRRYLKRRDQMEPLEFYRQFELIHPFVDGNGRVGKILLAWLSGTLLDPEFPPDDLFGYPIANP